MNRNAYATHYLYSLLNGLPVNAPDLIRAGTDGDLLSRVYNEATQHGLDNIKRTWNEVLSRQHLQLAADVASFGRNALTLLTPADLRNLPAVEYLVPNLIVKGGYNVIYGAPGCGKTYWALSIAAEVAQRHRVVYQAGEGHKGYSDRLEAIGLHRNLDANALNLRFVFDPVNLCEPVDVQRLIEHLRPEPPALIIIDTLARAMVGFEENSTGDMGIVNHYADNICRELGSAVLLVHHTGHDGKHERGSSALRGAADMMLALTTGKHSIELACSKSKYDEPFETIHYRLHEVQVPNRRTEAVLVQVDAPTGLTPLGTAILKFLHNTDGGAKTGAIKAAVGEDPNGQGVQKALTWLKAQDLVSHAGSHQPYVITPKGRVAVCGNNELDLSDAA